MRLSIKWKLTVLFLLLITACLGFILYILIKYKNITLTIESICFSIFILLMYFIIIFTIRSYGQGLLIQLSDMISALIDMREDEVFSVLEDGMLSKLQSQVVKLSGILSMQNKRLRREHEDIKTLIADISHQLKTPLANLRIYCELLQDKSISISQRDDFTKNMQSQLNKLSFLMDNLIKMSRLESGIIVLNIKQESLNKTCLAAIKQVYQKAIQKNIEVIFLEKGDILTNHDINWCAEAIFNILDNAVKYTKEGGQVTLSIEKYEIYARIDIEDNGLGILEADINSIFKRFYRGNNSSEQEGVGLGLYLAREIITKQQGYIKVKSEKGRGSVFSIFLPV